MQSRSELQRLRRVFGGYEQRGFTQSKWSGANEGNQIMLRERSRELGALLDRHGLLPLTSRRILDLGCGTGELLAGFQEWDARPANLFGVDLLADRVEMAAKQFPLLTFLQANAEDLPFSDGLFDMICIFTVFSSILDGNMAWNIGREIERILTSNGTIIWYDFRVKNPANRHTHGMSRREIRALFPGFRLDLRSVTVVPPLARRLGAMTLWLYPWLARVSFLRTHYLGLLTRVPETRPRRQTRGRTEASPPFYTRAATEIAVPGASSERVGGTDRSVSKSPGKRPKGSTAGFFSKRGFVTGDSDLEVCL